MNSPNPPGDVLVRRPLKLRYIVAAWGLAAVVVLIQGVAEQAVDDGTVTLEFLLRWRLYPIALWALVTPLALRAARRWPVTAPRWPVHLAVHGALFSAWMLVSNALLRIPDALAGESMGREAFRAAIENSPGGAVVWILLVVLGRGRRRPNGHDRVEPLSLLESYRTYLVHPDEICWVEADGDHLQVHTRERTYRIRDTMKGFQRRLDDGSFIRIHRSTLVNLHFVREMQPYFHGDYVAILRDGTELRVPRSRRAAIQRLRGSA